MKTIEIIAFADVLLCICDRNCHFHSIENHWVYVVVECTHKSKFSGFTNIFLKDKFCLCKYLYLLIFYPCHWLGSGIHTHMYTMLNKWGNILFTYLPIIYPKKPKLQQRTHTHTNTYVHRTCCSFSKYNKKKSCIKEPHNFGW